MRETRDRPATVFVVGHDGSETAVGRVPARPLGPALVDVLARLQLAASRRGGLVVVRDAPRELEALLELVGLSGVLRVELRRQPELGEQRGEDEVVQPGDLLA